jgi:hypothetical protein
MTSLPLYYQSFHLYVFWFYGDYNTRHDQLALNFSCSGCAKVGPKTVKAAATSCPELVTVNLNYTAVTPVSLVPLVTLCKNLAVLKVAGVPNWVILPITRL